jgi:tetratricopeptide (TPR) repeat protein
VRRVSWFHGAAIGCAAILTLTSCAGPGPAPAAAPAPRAETAASGLPTPGAGSLNPKARLEAERLARATAGLRFDAPSGLLEVEPLEPPAGDATHPPAAPHERRAAAERHLAQAADLFASNQELDALEQFGLAARTDPGLVAAYLGIGAVLKRKGRLEPALAAFRTAVHLDGENPATHYELALALWNAGRREEAVAAMQTVLGLDGEHARAHERLAVWSYYAGDLAAARQHLAEAERLGAEVPAQLAGLIERGASGSPSLR